MAIQLELHACGIHVVFIAAKGVFYLDGDAIQAPQDKELRETQDKCPPRLTYPLAHHEGRDKVVQDQQAIACLSVWEWERHGGDLECLVELHHAVCELLEGSREDRRWDGEHPRPDVFYDQLLDPLEAQLNSGLRVPNCLQTLRIDALHIDELVLESHGSILPSMFILDFSQRERMQHAEEADECVLTSEDGVLLGGGCLAERHQRAASVEPLRPHHVGRGATIPEAAVGLRRAEHDQETNEAAEACPSRTVVQDASTVAEVS
mmetsp:Transcript_34003/g.89624  ORF Transcript_34003/g.89624 Transcript_34003/m.89624 type:complete len:263 (+) Transcript_34003:918-1706(+)